MSDLEQNVFKMGRDDMVDSEWTQGDNSSDVYVELEYHLKTSIELHKAEKEIEELKEMISAINDIKKRVNKMEPEKFDEVLKSWNDWRARIDKNPDLTEKGLHFQRLKASCARLISRDEYFGKDEVKR